MKKQNKKIQGVGGWLIVWIVYSSLLVISLFLNLLASFSLLPILGVGAFFWMIFNLSKKSKSAKRICTYFLEISIAIMVIRLIPVLFEAISGNYSGGFLLFDYVSFLLGGLIPVGLNIVWIFYFKKSKRVVNTFRK